MQTNNNFHEGSIICFCNTNKLTKAYQKTLSVNQYAHFTHIAIISKIENQKVYIFESVKEGIRINEYSIKEFQEKFENREIEILNSHKKLAKNLRHAAAKFSSHYIDGTLKTNYATKHLLNVGLNLSKENKTTRKRTLQSYKKGQLMTSKGKKRKGAICSELVSEIVKAAQIEKAALKGHALNSTRLKNLQENQKVLKFDSKAISPADLVNELISKHHFTLIECESERDS